MKQYLFFLTVIILFSSCEKAVSFDLEKSNPTLVVEAIIENDQAPVVFLSNSTDYFGRITPDILANSFVRNAVITISNGTKTHQLKESFFTTATNNKIYFYSIDSANLLTAFLGAFNTSYTLQIKVDDKMFGATTTIPALAKKIDSLWWKKAPDNPDSSKVVLVGKSADPPGLGNYIRYFTSVNGGFLLPGLNSVFDDQVIDGQAYTVDIERGVDRNVKFDAENYSFFNRGDTILVKFCNIDKATYDFWRTMEYSYGSIGNPFASPTKVLGNVNGALGYFGGYAVQYKTLVVPK
jgi:Domain of unknown function (DUF4249)